MAGDWLKMECSTPEKEEVLSITVAMGWEDPDLTVGKLFKLWRWFDQQTLDGNAVRVSAALLDRIVGVTGFAAAVESVGWLRITSAGVQLPNFDRHNGKTAKNRAQTAKRVATHKANHAGNDEGNADGNAGGVSGALPREEKRREEKKGAVAPTAAAKRPTKKCPEDFALDDDMREWAVEAAPLVDVDLETEKFKDHTFKTAMTDWPATWRNWMRNAQGFAAQRPPARTGYGPQAMKGQAIADRNQQVIEDLMKEIP